MRKVYAFLWIVMVSAAPWDVEQEAKEALLAKIQAKHEERSRTAFWKGYLVDSDKRFLNKNAEECAFCKRQDTGRELMQRMEAAGFHRMAEYGDVPGHCYGITGLFVKQLLDHPPDKEERCEAILQRLTAGSTFLEMSHTLSVNQPLNYIEVYKEDRSFLREELSHAIPWLKTSSMKQFFTLTLGRTPESYYFLTSKESAEIEGQFSATAIYNLLQKFENKLLFLSYKNKTGAGHCLAIYNREDKLLVFDANSGLLQFLDRDTLSWIYAEQLLGERLSWIAAFSLE